MQQKKLAVSFLIFLVPKTAMCIVHGVIQISKSRYLTGTKLKGRVGTRKKIETVTKMTATTFTLLSHFDATSSSLRSFRKAFTK